MRISDWSSDVCSSDLLAKILCVATLLYALSSIDLIPDFIPVLGFVDDAILLPGLIWLAIRMLPPQVVASRSEEHTSELQSLMRISYAVFCLKKKKLSIDLASLIIVIYVVLT